MKVDGKIAIVTGAAQGIGKAIASLLGERGADVVVSDLNFQLAQATAEDMRSKGIKCLVFQVDVSKIEECEKMAKEVVEKWGKIDILVNNAGITQDNVLLRMNQQQWDKVIEVNLKGTFNCTKAVLRYMFRQKSGRIVNIASVSGVMGNAGQANYCASEAGIIGFTKSIAREYAERGIRVNAVAPGFIMTSMTESIPSKQREVLQAQIPLKRLGTPDDVAQAVLFLASDASSYITGHVLHVNGGLYM